MKENGKEGRKMEQTKHMKLQEITHVSNSDLYQSGSKSFNTQYLNEMFLNSPVHLGSFKQ